MTNTTSAEANTRLTEGDPEAIMIEHTEPAAEADETTQLEKAKQRVPTRSKKKKSAKPRKTQTKKKTKKAKKTTEPNDQESEKLSPEEKQLRRLCEATIRKGKKWFFATGRALAVMNERRLYRETHATFDAYCKERWGFTDAHAHRLIGAFEMGEDLASFGDELVPKMRDKLVFLPRYLPRIVWRL